MQKPAEKPLEISREEFRRDPAAVYEVAATGRTVVILNEDQQPMTIISVPRNKLPMRFD
jgi:hypothetical protein